MRFAAMDVSDLCKAARLLGNGEASVEAIAELIAAARKADDCGQLLEDMVARARCATENHNDPALRLERWTRIAGLTGDDCDFQRATELIPEVSHPCARARLKKLIVAAYLCAGMTEDARKFARTIKSAYWGAEAWVEIAKRGDANDLAQAAALCRHIRDPLAKEEVEAQINALGK